MPPPPPRLGCFFVFGENSFGNFVRARCRAICVVKDEGKAAELGDAYDASLARIEELCDLWELRLSQVWAADSGSACHLVVLCFFCRLLGNLHQEVSCERHCVICVSCSFFRCAVKQISVDHQTHSESMPAALIMTGSDQRRRVLAHGKSVSVVLLRHLRAEFKSKRSDAVRQVAGCTAEKAGGQSECRERRSCGGKMGRRQVEARRDAIQAVAGG